jgi:hypothetical protein
VFGRASGGRNERCAYIGRQFRVRALRALLIGYLEYICGIPARLRLECCCSFSAGILSGCYMGRYQVRR